MGAAAQPGKILIEALPVHPHGRTKDPSVPAPGPVLGGWRPATQPLHTFLSQPQPQGSGAQALQQDLS